MTYLFDTAFCMDVIQKKPEEVLGRLQKLREGEGCISAVTLAELKEAADRSAYPEQNTAALMQFTAIFDLLPFDDYAAFEYGKLCAYIAEAGISLDTMQCMIAAHARAGKRILVSSKPEQYEQIPGLQVAGSTDFSLLR